MLFQSQWHRSVRWFETVSRLECLSAYRRPGVVLDRAASDLLDRTPFVEKLRGETATLFGLDSTKVKGMPALSVLVPLLDEISNREGRRKEDWLKYVISKDHVAAERLRMIALFSDEVFATVWWEELGPASGKKHGPREIALAGLADQGLYPKWPEPPDGWAEKLLHAPPSEGDEDFETWWSSAGVALRRARNWDQHSTEAPHKWVRDHADTLLPQVMGMLMFAAVRVQRNRRKRDRAWVPPDPNAASPAETPGVTMSEKPVGLARAIAVAAAGLAMIVAASTRKAPVGRGRAAGIAAVGLLAGGLMAAGYMGAEGATPSPVDTKAANAADPDKCAPYEEEAKWVDGFSLPLKWTKVPPDKGADWEVYWVKDLASKLDRSPSGPSLNERILVITGEPGVGKSQAAHVVLAKLCKRHAVRLFRRENLPDILKEELTPDTRLVVLDDMEWLSDKERGSVAARIRELARKTPATFLVLSRGPIDGWSANLDGIESRAVLDSFTADEGRLALRRELGRSRPAVRSGTPERHQTAQWTDAEMQSELDKLHPATGDPDAYPVRSFHDATAYAKALKCLDGPSTRPTPCSRYRTLAEMDDAIRGPLGDVRALAAWRTADARPRDLALVGSLLDAWAECPKNSLDRNDTILRILKHTANPAEPGPPPHPCPDRVELALTQLMPAPSTLQALSAAR